jgi:anti-sigma B factor antagonist
VCTPDYGRGIELSPENTDIYEEIIPGNRNLRGNSVEIKTATCDGSTILYIAGRIDTATAPELEQAINKEIGNGNRKILLNFSAVSYISSGGLRVLLATAKKLKNPGDNYALCGLSAEVFKILKLAGFTSIFSIYPSEGEALAGW